MLVGPSKPGESLGVVSGHVLVVRKEPHKGRLDRFGKVGALGSWISVGRQSGSEVMVNDFSVSKHHARIRANETGFEIEDLGSSNQTSLNGVKLVSEEVTPLENGDMLRFGRIEVRFYTPRGLYQLLAPTISDFGDSIGQALAED